MSLAKYKCKTNINTTANRNTNTNKDTNTNKNINTNCQTAYLQI